MKKLIFVLSVLLLTFLFTNQVSATSGTCSWHGGVNCEAGTDYDGSAICVDGWRDSTERYSDVTSCRQLRCTTSELDSLYAQYNIIGIQNQITDILTQIAIINANLQTELTRIGNQPINTSIIQGQKQNAINAANLLLSPLNSQKLILESSLQTANLQKDLRCQELGATRWNNYYLESLRLYSSPTEETPTQTPATNSCTLIPNGYLDNGECKCKEGYLFYADYKTCETPEKACLTHYNYSKYENNLCSCIDGYSYVGNNCVKNSTAENNLTENISTPTNTTYIEKEKSLVKNKSVSLTNKLKGKILLQVESVGEAWYVNPTDGMKYYLQNGAVAYEALKKFGAGISNVDIAKIPIGVEKRFSDVDTDGDGLANQLEEGLKTDQNIADTDGDGVSDGKEVLENNTNPLGAGSLVYSSTLANRFKGRILLQVQSYGEAWYINPDDGKRYYMKNGEAAYQIMRFLSLGINNDNLRKISVGDL